MSRPFRPFEFNDAPDERRHNRVAGFVGLTLFVGVLYLVLWFLFGLAEGIAGK